MADLQAFLPYYLVWLGLKNSNRAFKSFLANIPKNADCTKLSSEEISQYSYMPLRYLSWPLSKVTMARAENDFNWFNKNEIKIAFFGSKMYPKRLERQKDSPAILFIRGSLEEKKTCVAIVGTRSPTRYGMDASRLFASELSRHGICIISGLARGIDGAAHRAAIEESCCTVAVLGSGLDIIYPKEHEKLAMNIIESGGALLSEYPLGFPPKKENFPKRNRILAGLSDAVIVVEARTRSGALITARLALEQGKDIYAIPGSIFSPCSEATHQLIKDGASLVMYPKDVLLDLHGFASQFPVFCIQNNIIHDDSLSEEEKQILSILDYYPTHIDLLCSKMNMPENLSLSALTSLELKGLIFSLPGKLYQKTVKS